MAKGKAKKIVVLGVGTDHHAVYSEVLKNHKVIFASSQEEAFTAGINADVLAVNIDKHNSFLKSMFDRVYAGKLVAIATSRKLMNKLVELPNGGKLTPVCSRTAPEEIMRVLAV